MAQDIRAVRGPHPADILLDECTDWGNDAMTRTPIPVPKPTRRPKDRKAVMVERSKDQRAYRTAHPTCEVRIALLDRYGNVLVTSPCNEQATEVHHLVPRGMGGSSEAFVHSDEDKMSVCRPHHRMIELHRFL